LCFLSFFDFLPDLCSLFLLFFADFFTDGDLLLLFDFFSGVSDLFRFFLSLESLLRWLLLLLDLRLLDRLLRSRDLDLLRDLDLDLLCDLFLLLDLLRDLDLLRLLDLFRLLDLRSLDLERLRDLDLLRDFDLFLSLDLLSFDRLLSLLLFPSFLLSRLEEATDVATLECAEEEDDELDDAEPPLLRELTEAERPLLAGASSSTSSFVGSSLG